MTAIKLRTETRTPFDYSRLERPEARFAERAAERIRGLQRAAVIDIGHELLNVKERLQHGDFIDWIEQECGFGRRTAVNLMHVALRFGGKWESVSHLPPNLLYRLAAPSTPDDFRQQILDVSSGERLDARSLSSLLAERRRQEVKAKHRQRKKSPTASQMANDRQKINRELREQQQQDARDLALRQQAEDLADLIAGCIGDRSKDVIAGLEKVIPQYLTNALRVRLIEFDNKAGRLARSSCGTQQPRTA